VAAEIGKQVDVVLLFEIADEALVARLSARTTCGACQTPFAGRHPGETHAECTATPKGTLVRRADDEPESIRNRLRVYKAQTEPVVAWYRSHGGNVQGIDGLGSFEDVATRALRAVGH
jgi:adenylate kinase